MSSVPKHVVSFLLAFFIIEIALVFGGQNLIFNLLDYNPQKISQLKSELKSQTLRNDLETGKVVVFGSSELSAGSKRILRFMVSNFFSDNNQPIKTIGKGGHQLFIILSELAALHSSKTVDQARIVVLLSPTWFTGKHANGAKMSVFLKYMTNDMMYKLYTNSEIDDHYKFLVSEYITANEKEMSGSSKSYDLIKNYGKKSSSASYNAALLSYLSEKFLLFSKIDFYNEKDNYQVGRMVKYDFPSLDYDVLYEQAKRYNKEASTNNVYGIRNGYFNRHVIRKDKSIRFSSVGKIRDMSENREYDALMNLLALLKEYKIKPLFVMQDLHPSIYTEGREEILPLLATIKASVVGAGFEYLDMWSYREADYVNGKLKDKMHLGELGWVKINKKIIEHFNLN
ncbi:D-alanyl-lipoteichoic acid biosynthesis protein DltD [Halodesulfovibrio aestuarii]|uniref:D-alanine transfer protein n=1 Tax=Halodesulfovibrio aestuarii TaxID=126333 RepID=A0A8G2FAV8_9BACT|nr:D-alanyl-lipoteichoic acid biosynthesis protein DltD [Halodesulfovibrio aestuarii]SHJ01488.1 D-alanine transfer protein [Halodesulfovibrio aestuarii]